MKAAVLAAALLATACAGSPPQHFYTLGSDAKPPPRGSPALYTVSVGPVSVPAIVDRPQFVLSDGPNRVTLAEQSRWAEPLKDNIARAMAADLAHLLPEAEVFANPRAMVLDPDYRVAIDVQRFESSQGSAAEVDILWAVSARQGGTPTGGRSSGRETVQGGDLAALAAAHGRALSAVSRDIAAALKAKGQQKTGTGTRPGVPQLSADKEAKQ